MMAMVVRPTAAIKVILCIVILNGLIGSIRYFVCLKVDGFAHQPLQEFLQLI